ncbi:hypothetical protein PROFUN_01044 [Planoprotostelium fungivorum]|uniref:Uncharacterized protein n=1 Tax=Planoprotostelium fungivorum TaxID=1890364 RepID=A0A2P6N4L1_9EUKA|nr:hypothetical protein PROFUN_01044 [Planoprotostelium fungivorum]
MHEELSQNAHRNWIGTQRVNNTSSSSLPSQISQAVTYGIVVFSSLSVSLTFPELRWRGKSFETT